MKTIFENEYIIIKIDEARSIYYFGWTSNSANMTEEVYLAQASKLLEEYLKLQYKFIIDDGRNFLYPILPEMQEKVSGQIISLLNGKVTKMAHLMAEELLVSMSVEQLWSENKASYKEEYFSDYETAEKWVVE